MAVAGSAAEALAAVRLGATHLQLRAPALSARRLLEEAQRLASATSLPLVINDRADIAALTGAGVHLPERGLPVEAARRLLGPEALIGRSVHGPPAAAAVAAEGADYVLYGPIWATASHPGEPGLGVQALAALAASVSIPVLAIGGAGPDKLEQCLAAGAAGYAAIGAFRA